MKIYKAFLMNEWILLKRYLIWMPIFLIISIGFVVAPYTNRYNISGIHYPDEVVNIIAFIGCVFGIFMLACTCTTQTAAFEKFEGMSGFFFSQNISKLTYILAKVTIPLILAAIGSIVPLIVYFEFMPYSVKFSLITITICIFTVVIVGTLIPIISAQFLSRESDIALSSFGLTALILTGLNIFTKPWKYSLWVFSIGAFFIVLALFTAVYLLLCKRETEIKFERFG